MFEQNLGLRLSIDETSLSHGELYTVVTNKEAKGKKGTLVAIIEGTKSENIIPFLQKLSLRKRNKVEEITLDLAGNMGLIAKKCFPNAVQVIDRFHVQQLATEALQEIRIKHRWDALAKWCERVEQSGFKSFNTISRTINNHYKNIINYFDNRSTNASAESFNAKIKAFRAQFRGVRNVNFFLFRITKLYA